MKVTRSLFLVVLVPLIALNACKTESSLQGQRVITLLATNDMHGGVEPQRDQKGQNYGGMALLAGAFHAIKKGVEEQGQGKAGVLVLDAGDQFQGTLLSNYNEGQLMFSAMNEVGYDAVIPGNHDYDFGPLGWLQDRVTPGVGDQNPRGALERLAQMAQFPLLSANTYFRNSIVGMAGEKIQVKDGNCPSLQSGALVDWSQAKRPAFLQPYLIKNVAGVRVALIGLDNQFTSKTTTAENVSDLCFRNEAETYLSLRKEIGDQADVFVLVVHNGNSNTEFSASDLVQKIESTEPGSVHAVLAGHTHFVNHTEVAGVPIIQSGAGGEMFGRVDLAYDLNSKKVTVLRTFAGLRLNEAECAPAAAPFCSSSAGGQLAYEGTVSTADSKVLALVQEARKLIAPFADRVMGQADQEVKRDRISESPLADLVTDLFRDLSGADIAMVNSSGLRENLPQGKITYENLFRVIPFGNHGLVLGPVPAERLLKILERSIRTCGNYGALLQSGLIVQFKRDCTQAKGGIDPQAQLLHVETVSGEVLFDRARGVMPAPGRTFKIATLDFVADGEPGLAGIPVIQDLGIFREVLGTHLQENPFHTRGGMDGRWTSMGDA